MTPAIRTATRREILLGLAFAVCATAVAIRPGKALVGAVSLALLAIPLAWWILDSPTRWLVLFFGTALLLPPLPIEIGNSGPHIAVLVAGAGLLIGVVRMAEWRLKPDKLTGALLLLFAILFASVAMAAVYSGLVIAAGSLVRVLLFGISIYIFLYLRNGPGNVDSLRTLSVIRMLFWMAVASAIFACVDFYFQFPAPAGFGPQFIWLESGVFRRAQGIFYEASTLGNFCVFFLLMIAVAWFRPRESRPVPQVALLAGSTALAAALVLSYSRASLINLAVSLSALLWLNRKRFRLARLVARIAAFGAAVVAILAFAFPVFSNAYWQRVLVSGQYFFESPNAILSGRLRSWEFLGDFLASHPWHMLAGVGYKTLPYSDFLGATSVADNTYLSILVETGIAGLIALIAVNVTILTSAYRAARGADTQRSFCGAWIFCFWAGQTVQMLSADLLTYWRVLPVYFCILALALRNEANEDSLSRPVQ